MIGHYDPHEYANVLGLDGIRYVLESTKNLAVDFFIMLPSCVPATHLETAGARLTADDLKLMIHDKRIAGVAELMNFPGVFLGIKSELAKIEAGKGKAIDGHAPGLRGKNLNAHALAGVRSDHESVIIEEAREKLRLGMHILLREGSTERNLEHLIPLINPRHNSQNCSFATDDKLSAGDLVNEGHVLIIVSASPFNSACRPLRRCKSPPSTPRGITGCKILARLRRVTGLTLSCSMI